MKCPSCGDLNAYEGLLSVDCPNPNCRYFSGNKQTSTATMPVPSPTINSNPLPIPSNPTPSNPTPSNPTLTVAILLKVTKINSILISFKAAGDPGNPNKTVEFYFTTPLNSTPQVCTLSNTSQYYVSGVDANGTTIYNTHWLCTNDGVRPTDPHTLTANIF